MYSTLPISTSFTQQRIESYSTKILYGRSMIIRNISRVDQAVCWPDFTAPYSTKSSAELSSRFRLTLSCCSTTSTVDEVQWYARYAIKLVYCYIRVSARDIVVPPLPGITVASIPHASAGMLAAPIRFQKLSNSHDFR